MQRTFAQLLPGEVESQFLRACIDPSETGRAAWQAWRAQHVLQDALEHDGTGKKRLLPLLAYTLEQNGTAFDNADVPILRAARMREQLRADKLRSILRQALAALNQGAIEVRLLKGAAISQTVYPNPDVRHTHDLDLLVRMRDLTRAGDLLCVNDFNLSPTPRGAQAADLHLIHASGLPLVLHTTLFQSPDNTLPEDEIWAQHIPLDMNGVATQILSPETMLVHVLGHTFYTAARTFRMWVSDAFFLVTRTPTFDWGRVNERAIRARRAVPVFLTLDYMYRALGLAVPQATLHDLKNAASKTSQRQYESALTLLRRNGQGGYRHWLKTAQNPQERLQVARWVLRAYGKNQ